MRVFVALGKRSQTLICFLKADVVAAILCVYVFLSNRLIDNAKLSFSVEEFTFSRCSD